MSNGRGGRRPSMWLRLLPALSIILFLLLWEMVVRLRGIPPIVLPAPSSIFSYLVVMIVDGSLPYHLIVTFAWIIAGLCEVWMAVSMLALLLYGTLRGGLHKPFRQATEDHR